jgi:hypothetical protein
MRIKNSEISFTSTIYGTKKDFLTAQKTAALFEQALDRQNIQYGVSTYVIPPIISLLRNSLYNIHRKTLSMLL